MAKREYSLSELFEQFNRLKYDLNDLTNVLKSLLGTDNIPEEESTSISIRVLVNTYKEVNKKYERMSKLRVVEVIPDIPKDNDLFFDEDE